MKKTWLYKELNKVQNDSLSSNFHTKTLMGASLINIPISILISVALMLSIFLWIITFFLGIFKDLYDLYYYLNAKKEAIKKALKLKNDIKNWIVSYQIRLNNISPYMLEKITYEEKPKVEQLPGVNTGYQGGIKHRGIYIEKHNMSFRYGSYNNNTQSNIKKELLSKEFINSKHSKFEDFIIEFFKQYNNECNTVSPSYNRHICDTNRRRSLHDIYLITKYYYTEVTFIDIIKTILSLLKIGVICSCYCSTVNKYVFYTPNVSNHNNFKHTLEFTDEITLDDLKKYIEDE